MAVLIPSMGACVSRMTGGERRLAERLEHKLDADYRLWYDVPMGPRNTHPDFCILHPRRGILALERDAQLVQADGPHAGKLAFPWSYGVVFTNITRKQFEAAELHHAIEPHRVLCQDEMLESVDAEDLQSRLWDMFPFMMRGVMSLPQIDRVRWIMFPEVRVQQGALFDDDDEDAALPDIMRVMLVNTTP